MPTKIAQKTKHATGTKKSKCASAGGTSAHSDSDDDMQQHLQQQPTQSTGLHPAPEGTTGPNQDRIVEARSANTRPAALAASSRPGQQQDQPQGLPQEEPATTNTDPTALAPSSGPGTDLLHQLNHGQQTLIAMFQAMQTKMDQGFTHQQIELSEHTRRLEEHATELQSLRTELDQIRNSASREPTPVRSNRWTSPTPRPKAAANAPTGVVPS